MPELAEVHGYAQFINECSKNAVYTRVWKSEVSTKSVVEPFPSSKFTISARARGKELILTLTSLKRSDQQYVRVNCGMTGRFHFYPKGTPLGKHAHLNFESTTGDVLSFYDQRRFGRWRYVHSKDGWDETRSPCPVTEHKLWLAELPDRVASRPKYATMPVCEALLDQALFNGIGNYLRAEILHLADIAPFTPLGRVWEDKRARDELLRHCHEVPASFLKTQVAKYFCSDDDEIKKKHWAEFEAKLLVYGKAKSEKDGLGRMIWYHGSRGGKKSKQEKKKKKKKASVVEETTSSEEESVVYEEVVVKRPNKRRRRR